MSPDTINYRFTVADPGAFAQPWSAECTFNAAPGPVCEYICHAGNYVLPGILAGAREEEKAQAATPAISRN